MFDILKAVKAKFEGDATLLAAYTTLHTNIIPEGTALPYARQFIVSEVQPDAAFTTRYISETRVQVSLFHTNLATLKTHFLALKTLLDRATLTLETGTFLNCTRGNSMLATEEASLLNGSNSPVYHAWADFVVKADRAY